MTQQIQSDIINNQIPDGWVETTLGEVVKIFTGESFKGNLYEPSGSLRVIRGENVSEGFLRWDTIKYWNHSTQNLGKYFLQEDDIVIGMDGSKVGKNRSMIREKDLPLILAQRVACLRSISTLSNQHYIAHLILNKNFEQYVVKIHTGTSIPHISQNQIANYPIILPPILEQKNIATLLSSFDNKIELLREENKTLEQTAQTIFQEWFGKYDIENELPEGWRVGKLGEEFNISIGRTPPRVESQWFSNVPIGKKWISIKDIGNCGVYIFDTSEYLTDESIKKFNIPVIPENTTILSFKMTVGKLTITTEEMLSNEAIAHLKIRDNSDLTSEFIYCYLQALDFNSLGSTSSIVTAINSTIIKAIEIIVPDEGTLGKFNSLIKPIFEKIKNNSKQIQSLSQTRDELLPKLMKGEVRTI
ncbi:restriction endonuclease subunit S [Candidatus Gracilibacteria bacterium]|nr:restriction endonuclease subunit S [Candidatus Gracilibacteria bacterium]